MAAAWNTVRVMVRIRVRCHRCCHRIVMEPFDSTGVYIAGQLELTWTAIYKLYSCQRQLKLTMHYLKMIGRPKKHAPCFYKCARSLRAA